MPRERMVGKAGCWRGCWMRSRGDAPSGGRQGKDFGAAGKRGRKRLLPAGDGDLGNFIESCAVSASFPALRLVISEVDREAG